MDVRLNGFRRYDSKEGIGRVESGTETESNAGAITEEQLPRGYEQGATSKGLRARGEENQEHSLLTPAY